MEKCPFCQIVKGSRPCFKIYEDEDFLAFLDTAPFTEGHTQVIPKKHYRWVWDLPLGQQFSPNIGHYFEIVRKIACHYQKTLGKELVTSIIWGTLVQHAHIQILPHPDRLCLGQSWSREVLTQEKGEKIQQKLSLT